MKFLLDSNILVSLALDSNATLADRAADCDADEMVTSVIAYAEVLYGSVRGKPPSFVGLELLREEIPVMPFDYAAARAYATLSFKRASYDRLIAAHALSLGLIVVTDNEKHFADVPGLKVENWTV
jgi:tRNA(fMet)-specific endonuclease VapC